LYDGAELGNALAAHPDDVEAAADGVELHELRYGDTSPQSLVDLFGDAG
jgi:hypothetical protein